VRPPEVRDIADTGNHRVRRVNLDGTIETVAGTGSAGLAGDGGPGVAAQLNGPLGIAVDGFGRLFIADAGNNRIRRVDVDANRTISRIAGEDVAPASVDIRRCGTAPGGFLGSGTSTSDPLAAQILSPRGVAVGPGGELAIMAAGPPPFLSFTPTSCLYSLGANGGLSTLKTGVSGGSGGIAIDAAGQVYFADSSSHRVTRLGGLPSTSNGGGSEITVAGTGTAGFAGDGASATSAQLAAPQGVAVDGNGVVFIADTGNDRVRRVETDGQITTTLGNGFRRFVGDGGPATSATIAGPEGVAVDVAGTISFADTGNHRVRRVDTEGIVSTALGTGVSGTGAEGGVERVARPGAVVVVGDELVVADTANDRILRVGADGVVTVVTNATSPSAVAVDESSGATYFTEGNTVRRIDGTGVTTTVAGTAGAVGFSGDGGLATAAQLNAPRGLVFQDGQLFIADTGNARVRRVNASGQIVTIAGKGPCQSFPTSCLRGDNGPATAAFLKSPCGLAFDGDGGLLIADNVDNRIRRATIGGNITTLVANTGGAVGLAVDASGTVYVADTGNDRIARVSAGQLTTVAGLVHPSGHGPFSTARLYAPAALAVLDASRLISVGAEGRLLVVDLARQQVNVGVGNPLGTSPTGAAGSVSLLADARGAAFDAARGRLVIAEHSASALRTIDVDADDDGVVDDPALWTVANVDTAATGPAGIALDGTNTIVVRSDDHCVVRIDASGLPVGAAILGRCGGRGTGPLLDGPSHVAVSPLTGAVYVSDTGNNRVVRVLGADVSDVIGDGSASTAGEGVPARDFPIDAPRQLAIDARGNLFIASNKVVRVVANVDGDDDADGDDQVLTIYGRGDRAAFPERESLCIAALALADDGSVFVADTCLGFLVRLTRQAPP
jgi:sugar lactone lactonase YvrE